MAPTLFGLPLRSALFDLALAGVVMLSSGFGFEAGLGPAQHLALGAIGLGMGAALLFRRRHCTLVLAVVALLALAQVLIRVTPLPYDLAVLVAAYSTVKYSRRLLEGFAAGAVLLAGVLIQTANTEPWDSAISTFLMLISVCAGVWLAGLTYRTRRLYVLSLEEKAGTLERERDHLARIAVSEERSRIARELHDIVAHSLAVMIVQADGARYVLDTHPEVARAAMLTVSDTGRESLEEMRRLVGVLREPAQLEGAVDRSPAAAMAQLDTLVERSTAAGLRIERHDRGEARVLPAALELTAYRIVQEALTNALKHAGAGTMVTLTLDHLPTELRITIVDDGSGRVPRAIGSGGHGLVGMRERAALYGGTLVARPRLAGGFEVVASLPLPA